MSVEEGGTQTQPAEGSASTTSEDNQLAIQSELWKSMISASVSNRKQLFETWKESVNYRVQKPFGAGSGEDQDRIAVPEDWARTKQKQSQLMFQLPKIVVKERRPEYGPSAAVVQASVNDKLRREVKAAYMVDECLADAINAAGLMISMVGVDIRTEQVPNPVQPEYAETVPDPADPTGMAMMPNPTPRPPVQMIDRIIYRKFYWKRISPAAFLWPAEFTGSNWDDAPWLGYETWVPEVTAKTLREL